ncbi:MAG: outer membrane porin, OprD family [Taibaiella sp.]|nr:outer membrane porin, OprD family [Taibaiella sp.]
MKQTTAFILFLFTAIAANAQHHEPHEKAEMWKGKQTSTDNESGILHAFKTGSVHGHARYYFMTTDNVAGLSDYYANAAGGGIKYETAKYKNFQFGVSGFFVFNIGSSNLEQTDPVTNQPNRYEVGLFDITDPGNKVDIDRLEELYLKYSKGHSHIVLGKQLINTPFINLQDGRMRPTEISGIWGEFNELKNTKIEGGYIYHISPRSTVRFYKVGESIGIYPMGVNSDGIRSDYAGNQESDGAAMLGVSRIVGKRLKLKIYDLYVDNIFNTALLQAEYTLFKINDGQVAAAGQYIRQDAVNEGGNADVKKAYYTPGGKAQTFGARLEYKNKNWRTSVNYNRITKDGRYLMPREWGKDPFFTFLPRERNEGFGDVHAYVVKGGYDFSKAGVKTQLGVGYFRLPDVRDYAMNKYGMPSYAQLNADVRYKFKNFLEGWDVQMLYVYKMNAGETYDNDKYVINKVDMSVFNFVVNFHF